MSNSSLVKAVIINMDFEGERVECLFNPKEYTFDKSNKWEQKKTSGKNVPQMTFGGGNPATLKMELFFDTYADTKPGSTPKDVRKEYTDKIWKLMHVDDRLKDAKSKKARPPRVRFQWGSTWSFNAVLESDLAEVHAVRARWHAAARDPHRQLQAGAGHGDARAAEPHVRRRRR